MTSDLVGNSENIENFQGQQPEQEKKRTKRVKKNVKKKRGYCDIFDAKKAGQTEYETMVKFIKSSDNDSLEDFKEGESISQRIQKVHTTSSSPKGSSATSGVLLGTCLSLDQKRVMLSLISSFGKFRTTNDWSSSVTHVIANDAAETDRRLRTLKVFKGLVSGLWILSYNWIEASKKAGFWVDEEPFELVSAFPGAKQWREQNKHGNKERLLFAGKKFFIHREVQVSIDLLQFLIQQAGGQVENSSLDVDYCVRSGKMYQMDPNDLGSHPFTITDAILLDSFCYYKLPEEMGM